MFAEVYFFFDHAALQLSNAATSLQRSFASGYPGV